MQPLQNVNLNREAGFTLIEFCVATLIMMVGLLGLLQAVNIAVEHNLGTILRNEAVSIADEQMVEVKNSAAVNNGLISTGWNDLATSTYTVPRKIRGGASLTFTIDRQVTQKTVKTKEVNIKVLWTYRSKTLNHQSTSLVLSPL